MAPRVEASEGHKQGHGGEKRSSRLIFLPLVSCLVTNALRLLVLAQAFWFLVVDPLSPMLRLPHAYT